MNAPTPRYQLAVLMTVAAVGLAACIDDDPTAPRFLATSKPLRTSVPCEATVATRTISCSTIPGGLSANIIGGQNVYLKVTTSNVSYDSGTSSFAFDLTLQNLLNEEIGTPGEGIPDPAGIKVFFHGGPTTTGGSGVISVSNPDGTASITAPDQPYFVYNEVLSKDEVSSSKRWELSIPSTVSSFSFNLLIEAEVAPRLVINEVMANPSTTEIPETDWEWFELYNAGSLPVELQNLVVADSAASGRRPFHLISSSVIIQPGAYAVLAGSTNTSANGGVTADYAFGSALSLANSLDAIKISRVFGTDTVTIDRIQYSNASVSAQSAISRELKNPALDNSNMDGSNWDNALVTAVYGLGGRGTPKAQNSTYTP
jgi:hypothetical protein